jgi:hypothetical protein
MEVFEKILNVFGYVSVPGVCQTAATVRFALAITQFAIGAIAAGYHEVKALWAYHRNGDVVTYQALRARVSEDIKWIEHAVLNVIRAVVEFFNFGWPIMILLALWDNLDLRITHRDGVSPFTQLAEKIDQLQATIKFPPHFPPAPPPPSAPPADDSSKVVPMTLVQPQEPFAPGAVEIV